MTIEFISVTLAIGDTYGDDDEVENVDVVVYEEVVEKMTLALSQPDQLLHWCACVHDIGHFQRSDGSWRFACDNVPIKSILITILHFDI